MRVTTFSTAPIRQPSKTEFTVKPTTTISDETTGELGKQAFSPRWALASLALSMLLSSLGVSIANVAVSTGKAARMTRFDASAVQQNTDIRP